MTPTAVRDVLGPLRVQFADGAGYLAACTAGLPTADTRRAMAADLTARPDPVRYRRIVEDARAHFAQLVGVHGDRVAIGSQTSVQLSVIAASLPDGAEVLCPAGDFSSLVMPFVHAGRGITVRTAPLDGLATAVRARTHLVVFSLVQSATGEVADTEAIVAAARAVGARTVCDATQAVGWMPVSAAAFDALVCHTYKWLSAPRGVSFLALSASFAATLRPVQAGWYAGDDPWASCYGGDAQLAGDARRFDVSPAWQAFVGAEPALRAFAQADAPALQEYTTGLAAQLRSALDLAPAQRPTPIVTWPDADGCDLHRLEQAGVVASGRRGRARVAFHVFNDETDVARVVAALRR